MFELVCEQSYGTKCKTQRKVERYKLPKYVTIVLVCTLHVSHWKTISKFPKYFSS